MNNKKFYLKAFGLLMVIALLLSAIPGAGLLTVTAETGLFEIFLPLFIAGTKDPITDIQVTMTPSEVIVGVETELWIRAEYAYDVEGDIPVLSLHRTDADGNIQEDVGFLYDDGNLKEHGDELAFDGIFSYLQPFTASEEGLIHLRINVTIKETLVTQSDVFSLNVFEAITEQEMEQVLTIQAAAETQYYDLVGNGTSHADAQQQVIDGLEDNEAVAQAGPSEDGNGIWIVHESGIPGTLLLNPEDTRSSVSSQMMWEESTQSFSLQPSLDESVSASCPQSATTDATNRVGNRRAIVLGAFNWQFGGTDDAPRIKDILEDSECPKFDVTYLLNSDVTVDVYKTLHEYGIVAITTHGDTYYKGILSLWAEKWGWDHIGGQVVFLTGQRATVENRTAYQADMLAGRVVVTNASESAWFGVVPSFINHYATTSYPDSLVYIGACRTTYNNTMANAFINNGAQTYLGYDGYVISAFAGDKGEEFFARWVNVPEHATTGQAFIPGQKDAFGTEFEMRGATDLHLPSSDIENGDFADGHLGAWRKEGDGRVISQLGPFTPRVGPYMGIISTGMGFTPFMGYIEQDVCLDEDATHLEFWWNFSSEEFMKYCGSAYQDKFEVIITTEAGTPTVLFSRTIDDLCYGYEELFLTNLVFSRGPNEEVWSTGWHQASIDISAIAAANAGKSVTLKFFTSDVGDQAWDTAVLLDGIRIVVPE